MTWCNDCSDVQTIETSSSGTLSSINDQTRHKAFLLKACPSCGHPINSHHQGTRIDDLPGLPAGVKFDPTDQELLQHLESKVIRSDACKLHPLIDDFIPTLEGQNGICYTHPQKLPGVNKDGLVRHFFHRPSKAYTTGTRKRRKVQPNSNDVVGGETRWHKTGKTRPVFVGGKLKGYKKILVLYTNYGKQKKPEKTNWVMHQYHLGNNEEEKDGELVVSKVFFQTQPRQCGNNVKDNNVVGGSSVNVLPIGNNLKNMNMNMNTTTTTTPSFVEYYNSSFISFDQTGLNKTVQHFSVHDGSSFVP